MSYYRNGNDRRDLPPIAGGIILTLVLGGITAWMVWFFHIPLNPNYLPFWLELLVVFGVVALCASVIYAEVTDKDSIDVLDRLWTVPQRHESRIPWLRYAFRILVAVPLIGLFVGSPVVSSGAYAGRLDVKESSFDEWSDDLRVEGISLMDTDSATMVGNRELGSLQDVVSQFDDARYYQVIIDGTPQKVAPLQYVGFFPWLNNRGTGAPGYVLVDPIKQNADYHKLKSIEGTGDGLRFVPSAFLTENLPRLLWIQYPTKVLGEPHFELDDEGHPFYVTQSFGYASVMGAKTVEGVIVTDPTNGESEYYATGDVPAWLDVVYDGDLLDEMYDDYGAYSGGFLNSIFGKVGCTRTGGDYGYVMIGDEQWIYTGVTSMGNDSSNVGFLLASEKTGEAHFLPMASADERSAMSSAAGKVQQYRYEASFPSLVSIDGQPTYVMVLKDSGGLIRLYAMVNAESYNVVACEPDLVTCKAEYEKAMTAAGIEFDDDEQEMPEVDSTGSQSQVAGGEGGAAGVANSNPEEDFSVKVAETQLADESGDTYLYVLGDDGNVYRIRFAGHPKECMGISKGDAISGKATRDGDVMDVTSISD